MRNGDDTRAAEGPQPDDGMNATFAWSTTRRRKQAVIGAVGLVSILGIGGLVATQALDDDPASTASSTGALVPVIPGAGPSASGATTNSSGSPATAAAPTASSTAKARLPKPSPKTTAERIAAVRSLAAKPNNQVRRPPAPKGAAAIAAVPADVATTEVHQGGEKIVVSSARQDLTGFNQLGLVADKGTAYGDVRCTKKIRVRSGEQPRERPTLLICWRTSATRSVYTVSVKLGGRPDPKLSVAALNKQWATLA